jgi:hypothetical protein
VLGIVKPILLPAAIMDEMEQEHPPSACPTTLTYEKPEAASAVLGS